MSIQQELTLFFKPTRNPICRLCTFGTGRYQFIKNNATWISETAVMELA